MELTEITEAIGSNEELMSGLTSHLLETDKMKEILTNKANSIYQNRISEEVSNIHKQYDNDMFEILGERPGVLEDGIKQKTYDKVKSLYSELKELRESQNIISKDSEVVRLTAEIEDLKKNGPGAHWEQTFNNEKVKWAEEKKNLLERADEAEKSISNFKKQADIEAGLRDLKFDESVPEVARKALVDGIINNLINNSKIEDNKVVYLNPDGSRMNDSEFRPMNASDILKLSLKDVLKNENKDAGGGAPATLQGSIETTSVEGKNVNRLALQEGSFKSKSEFIAVAEEALLKSGYTRSDSNWDNLKNEAYNRYNVSSLPR